MAEKHLTMADAGSVIQVSPGDTVAVTLDQTASTGYLWSVDEPHVKSNASILELRDDEVRGSALVGGKGSAEWIFEATEPGTTQLQFKLWREWEGDKSVIERFEATVKVS